ncbi:enoyl-CoA hydratase/isomerase family protein [Paraburkholderia youngii]|uniref:enoyl-CoA hydratase/isomerase family protein n=1 Tax=Paraburkholderia youngii TaxID=2782701 RepID=UPI001590C8E4|nr:enoyl-CoA hydratase/isomerase family protein [Paraburkholderia youngii]NUX56713.1 enoyl-CoA hydratase/isomerase family protein [Paraburkholderia youngii]
MTLLTVNFDDGLATIVIDRPPQNRIDDQMIDELATAVAAIERSDARAVLVRSEGENFSFGGDIMTWPEANVRELRARFAHYMSVFNRFEHLPVPVVAAVQGLCFGGGFELALRADVIFAGESATFGHPEQTLGIVTVLGGIYRVAERAGRSRASEWALTSEKVAAATMERFGIVNRVVADADLLKAAADFARKLAHGPTRAYAAHKALLRAWAVGGVAAADEAMFDIAMPLFESDDAQRGIRSAVEALKAGRPRPVMDFNGQ